MGSKRKGGGEVKVVTSGFIVVHIDSLQLQVTVSMVTAGGVDTVLITDHLPELRQKKPVFSPRDASDHNEKPPCSSDNPAFWGPSRAA